MSERSRRQSEKRKSERDLSLALLEKSVRTISDAVQDSCRDRCESHTDVSEIESADHDAPSHYDEDYILQSPSHSPSSPAEICPSEAHEVLPPEWSDQSCFSNIGDPEPYILDDVAEEQRSDIMSTKSSFPATLGSTDQLISDQIGLNEPSTGLSALSELASQSSSSSSDCDEYYKEYVDIDFPDMSGSSGLPAPLAAIPSVSACGSTVQNIYLPGSSSEVLTERLSDEALQTKLQKWAVKNNVRRSALDELLHMLREHGHENLPKSAKTIFQTPKNTFKLIRDVAGGLYWYRGLLHALLVRLSVEYVNLYSNNESITIDIFVDGLSPHKSISRHLWPICGCLINDKKPFTIAMWCGEKKQPSDVDEFLSDFIEEAESLMTHGFVFNDKKYFLKIRHILADAPARAWVRKVNQHGSYFSCERCTIKGEWIGSRITYNPYEEATLRTDDNFRAQSHENYHKGVSMFLKLNINMVTQFPLDIMHLIYLGNMKRFMAMLLKQKGSRHKLKDAEKNELSQLCIHLQKYFPSEFERKPKHLSDWATYKAIDFRRILLYEGIVVFKKFSNSQLFHCFLLLSCGMRILVDNDLREKHSKDAGAFLEGFVQYSYKLFGPIFVVYNVHHLKHLEADCALHGNPEGFSCFKFENSLGDVKKMLHAPGRVLIQVVNRTLEKEQVLNQSFSISRSVRVEQPHQKGPTLGYLGDQYMKLVTLSFEFGLNLADSCCLMKDGSIVIMENFLKNKEQEIFVIGRAFQTKTDFFKYPINSSYLGIFEVTSLGELQKWSVNCIYRKVVLLPKNATENEKCVCIPMLHSEG